MKNWIRFYSIFLFSLLLIITQVGCQKSTVVTSDVEEIASSDVTDEVETSANDSEVESSSETIESTEQEPTEISSTEEDKFADASALPTDEKVFKMLQYGLQLVQKGYGYSLYDRIGENGHFDCSGLISVMLRDGLGETNIGWQGTVPWDTMYWRAWAKKFNIGDTLLIGEVEYVVLLKDSDDYENAWSIPGTIVIQYPPEDGSSNHGHASIALGKIPYQSIGDVIEYLNTSYGVELSEISDDSSSTLMVIDGNGVDSGHITWRINANGYAEKTCVDNNYTNRPGVEKKVAIAFAPKSQVVIEEGTE